MHCVNYRVVDVRHNFHNISHLINLIGFSQKTETFYYDQPTF